MPKLNYKYRIYPFQDQKEILESWFYLCRKLYNAALEQRQIAFKMGFKVGYKEQRAELVNLKKEMLEYAAVPSHVLQNVLLRLDKAFENFFRRCKNSKIKKKGFPRFKNRDNFISILSPDVYPYLKNGKLHFPKMSPINIILHRELPKNSKIKTCSISKKSDGWYANFCLEIEEVLPSSHFGDSVGIDVGLTSFAALSNGEEVKPPKFFKKAEKKLRRAQRKLSKKKKGSKKRQKQKEKVSKIHLKVQRQRDDWLKKLASNLAKRFSLIGVEKLNVKEMVKNSYLSKSIQDASWASFRQKLDYAAVKAGSRVISVDPKGTSQRCSSCDFIVKKDLKERWHSCPHCGLSLGRDHNAAENILKLALVLRDTQEFKPKEKKTSRLFKKSPSRFNELGTVLANIS